MEGMRDRDRGREGNRGIKSGVRCPAHPPVPSLSLSSTKA